jgi:hypothetical protein
VWILIGYARTTREEIDSYSLADVQSWARRLCEEPRREIFALREQGSTIDGTGR